MSIADKLTLLAASKEMVRLKLGIGEDVPFSEYSDHVGWDGITSALGQSTTTAASQKLVTDEVDKTKDREALLQTSITSILGINNKLTNRINALEESNISSLFNNGASNGMWLDPSDLKTMFQRVGGASLPVTKDGDPVGLMLDKSQGLEGAVTNVAKPFMADMSNDNLEVINTSDGTKLLIKQLSTTPQLRIFEVGKTYKLSIVYSMPESSNDIPAYNTEGGASNHLFTATKGVRNKVEVTLTARSTALYFRSGPSEITLHEVVFKEIKGNHASQTLAASRPTYRTDGVLHWLEFDGVDDFLNYSLQLGKDSIIALSANKHLRSVSFHIGNGNEKIGITNNFMFFRVSKSGVSLDLPLPTTEKYTLTAGKNNGYAFGRVNNNQVDSIIDESLLESTWKFLGYSGTTSQNFIGNIYSLLAVDGYSVDNVKTIENYAGRKAGVEIQ